MIVKTRLELVFLIECLVFTMKANLGSFGESLF